MKHTIAVLSAHPLSLKVFMAPHIRELSEFYTVQAMANTEDSRGIIGPGLDVHVLQVPLVRSVSAWADLKALWVLFWCFHRSDLSALHTITPKAGLLGIVAAWLARVPIRVHTFTGQVWVTRRAPMRWILKLSDKLVAALATDVLVDSPSQREFLISEGVLTDAKSSVLCAGSICGVDIRRFSPDAEVRLKVRGDMGSSSDALVCLYLGRLNHDKGVLDLASAFAQVSMKHPTAELWVVGPDEGGVFTKMQDLLFNCSRQIRRVGYTDNPEHFMRAADLFCLPSYREGFGSSVIEAGSCAVPALVSRIYGLTDAVVEGKTGWMHNAGDISDIAKKLDAILSNPLLLKELGRESRVRVKTLFEQSLITRAMLDFYKNKFERLS